ncbi:MAG: DUF5711 family protein [Lachnospiraceae bacterium]|nr:DUF5711 family protein [Lachnospiraceae bacterium]
MSDTNNLERQERKRELRRNIQPDLDAEGAKALDARILRRRRYMAIRILGVILVALLVFAAYRSILRTRKFTEATVVWENTDVAGGNATYEAFGNYVVKVSNDGISCIDRSGTVLWNSGYTMSNPAVCIRGDYGAVADIQSETAVIFDESGVLGTVNTTLSILNLTISSHGVLALVLDDSEVNYVTFYDNTGNELDIRIKTKLSGDGYPLDIALFPKGTGLIASVMYLDQGTMQNQIVFYNFDVGQSESDRVVGYFACGETVFPQVVYLSDTVACACGDNQVSLYSLENESQPTLTTSIEVDSEIRSVLTGEDRLGIICDGEEGGSTLAMYDTSGRQIYTAEIDFEYTHAEFSGENVLIYNETECLILGARGSVRFRGSLEGGIVKLVYTGSDSALLFTSTSMERLRFS